MKRHILSLAVLLLACTLVSAQSLRGSYFFETSPQRGKMNAAFAPQVNYVSVPLLGAVGVETWSNAGLGQFVFPTGGSLKTFMHPDISADSFLSALPDGDPYLKERLEMDLLGGGFRLGANGYASIGVSVLEDGSALVPKEFLRFAKLGENGSYPGPQVSARIYGALSLGYSHDLGDLVEGLRVGGRVKLLSGLYAGDIDLRKIEIGIDAEQVSAATEGEGHLAGIAWKDSHLRADDIALRGFAVAVDLGVEYRLRLDGFINGVNLSASVNDLGTALRFNKGVSTLTTGATASFTGLQGISTNYDFKENLQRVIDDFSRLTDISSAPADSYESPVRPSFYAGVEVPFLNEMISVGALYYRTAGFNHLMASLNLSPLYWLNLSVNGTFLGPVNSYGCYAEIIPKNGLGLFFGLNAASLKTSRHHIPINNFSESACLGLNVVFGGK